MAWLSLEVLGLVVVMLFLLYYYSTSTFDFWKKRGVKGPQPIPFFGNFKDVLLGKESVNDCFMRAYDQFKEEPLIGLFEGHIPLLVVQDPDLIKDVLIKDFSSFAERTLLPDEKVDPLSLHLFRLDAVRWKPLRTRLSPVFTSGKLKEMFYLLLECSDQFEKYLHGVVAKNETIECREVAAKFNTDVIGSCAFGIETNALAAEDSEFRKMGRKVFQTTWKTALRDKLRDIPFLFKIFGPFLIDHDIADFFKCITKQTIDYRMANNIHRHDFIDTLVDLKQNPQKLGMEELDDAYATAQAFVFFAAGFETSSITISNLIYELALNPSIQEKVRTEIKNVLEKHDGKITYESLGEMKYLTATFDETLRKYPVLLYLSRSATANYTFSGTKISIPEGQKVFLPVFAMQRDPEIYPEPDAFNPERFIEGNTNSRHAMHYLPFGDGPRNCIGARFAKLQSKVAVIKIISNFKAEVCEKTVIPYVFDKRALFFLQPNHGIYVKLTKLKE